MLGLLVLLYYFLVFPGLIIPVSLFFWILFMRLGKRKVQNPFTLLDLITPFVSILIWIFIDTYFLSIHKRMGNFIELVGLGSVWTLLILLRFCLLWIYPGKSKRMLVFVSDLGVMVLAVIFALVIPATVE